MSVPPKRGDIWYVDLDPVRGHEQGRMRPALIVSADIFNASPAELVIVIPITTTDRRIPTHIRIDPPEGGLTRPSYAKVEDIRSISTLRLLNRTGEVSDTTLQSVEDALVIVLDLRVS